jgi:radical SAM protein with 4Fe4S-binding SPASM domain
MNKPNKKIHDEETFLDYRRKQEREIISSSDTRNPLSSLLTVELNTTELCNRKCIFCPRYDKDVYPNRNLNMSVETAKLIVENLANFNYLGKISYSGYSENLLNKKFCDIISIMRESLPNNVFECNTNGDFLNKDYTKKLFASGLSVLYINLYDGVEQIERFTEIMEEAEIQSSKYKFRAHYTQEGARKKTDKNNYGLYLNNRGGNITWIGFEESDIDSLKGKPCYYPFYKMFVDWNGDVLFCSNDWGKEIIVGNLTKQSLMDVWFGEKMFEVRERLAKGDRSQSPCSNCSVKGTLFGEDSFKILNKWYEDSNNRSH